MQHPLCRRLGDIGELNKTGSLHQYLAHLHDEGRTPVTSFWWGKEQVVSICSPQAFKDTVKLTDRASECVRVCACVRVCVCVCVHSWL